MSDKLSHRMSASDASFLYLERPNAPLHIGSLGVYEGQIPHERFLSHIDSRLPQIPRYRQRVAFVPLSLAHPTWEDDPKFQTSNHIHHVTLPPPGDAAQLRKLAVELFAKPLNRDRPLWEMFVINGIEHDRSGILAKVHHCMVDGVSGVELLIATVDISPEPAPPPPASPWEPKELPSSPARVADAFWDNVAQQLEIAQEVGESIIDPRPRIQRSQDMFRSLTTASPWLLRPAPRTPFTGRIGPEREVAFSELSFVEIREIRTALGGTVNDVVLAILAGALRRYYLEHGESVEGAEPRVAIPVNVRMEEEGGSLGNRISGMLTPLPIGEADPARRLATVRERLDTMKRENQAASVELLTRLGRFTPAPLQALGGLTDFPNTLVNMICTNVPGPMIPLYSVGHMLIDHFPMVPLSLNMGLGVGVMSYNQRLYFGLMVDPGIVPDVQVLRKCVDESYLELRDAAGVVPADVPEFPPRSTNGIAAEPPAVPAQTTTV